MATTGFLSVEGHHMYNLFLIQFFPQNISHFKAFVAAMLNFRQYFCFVINNTLFIGR